VRNQYGASRQHGIGMLNLAGLIDFAACGDLEE
jgi:hypothetical protein